MAIELLEVGTMHSATAGWLGSRSLEQMVSAEEIAGIDASVNELPTALFYFRDMMILERELFVTPRNHVIWARTSRVDDPRLFMVPMEFRSPDHDRLRTDMRRLADEGVHQDQWRMMLPLCALTSWTARLTFRDAVRMVRYFIDVALLVQETNRPLSTRLLRTSNDIETSLRKAFGLPHNVIANAVVNFKPITIQSLPDYIESNSRRTLGEVTSLQMWLPIATRAQLARHREIIISDGFVHMLNCAGSEQSLIGRKVYVQAVALTTTWRTVLGKRTCWMAQADLWEPITTLFGGATAGLPCAGGACPYAEDAKQRLTGNDPGAPCPRYSNLTNTPLNDGQWEVAMGEAKTKANATMWRAELGVSKPAFVPCARCTMPILCTNEKHCDLSFNGYR